MKKNKNSILVFTFVILASIIGSITISKGTAHRGTNNIILDPNAFYITDAFYGDFDNDGVEDDIKVIAILDIDYEDEIISYLYLDIYLPSGFCFQFFVTIKLEANGNPLQFTFTAYNTALENGWYIAKLTGFFITDDNLYFGTTYMIFDPPGDDGEGDPEITVNIAYI